MLAGKGKWVVPRDDVVTAKGKGALRTCWLTVNARSTTKGSVRSSNAGSVSECEDRSTIVKSFKRSLSGASKMFGKSEVPAAISIKDTTDRNDRLVDWMTDLLKKALEQVVAQRMVNGGPQKQQNPIEAFAPRGNSVIQEVVEIIELPELRRDMQHWDTVGTEIDVKVLEELRQFVESIAAMYRNNPFHNFEHVR